MNTRSLFLVGATWLVACGSSSSGGPAENPGTDSEATNPGSDTGIVSPADAATDTATATDTGTPTDTGVVTAGYPVPAAPLISRDVPAFASEGGAAAGNDDNPADSWGTATVPAWLAYDISKVPASKKARALLSWNAIHSPCYIDTAGNGSGRPSDFTIETSAAAGGGSAPTDGWTPIVTIAGGRYCAQLHVADLGGANWVRFHATKAASDGVAVDFDVHDASASIDDTWLFMGDSITYMTTTYAFSDLPSLVNAAHSDHWPVVIDAALGGTNTSTAMAVIDDTMKDFPGRFVVLAYGTNDHANDFHMEELVQHVIAAGKTPVVPHMPWSSGSTEGDAINAQIDALYTKYPQILKGPDLWAFFNGRTDLIPVGDVHPNAQGQEELRKQWALAIGGTY